MTQDEFDRAIDAACDRIGPDAVIGYVTAWRDLWGWPMSPPQRRRVAAGVAQWVDLYLSLPPGVGGHA